MYSKNFKLCGQIIHHPENLLFSRRFVNLSDYRINLHITFQQTRRYFCSSEKNNNNPNFSKNRDEVDTSFKRVNKKPSDYKQEFTAIYQKVQNEFNVLYSIFKKSKNKNLDPKKTQRRSQKQPHKILHTSNSQTEKRAIHRQNHLRKDRQSKNRQSPLRMLQ